MSPSLRVPSWLPPISLVAIALLIAMVSFLFPLVPLRVTGQALLLMMILRAFCYWPPMGRWAAAMPVPHRVVFGLILAGMVLGHYTFNTRRYFPFVAWEIFPFVSAHDPVTCRQFLATTASGKKVRLLAEQLFPSIVQIENLDDPRYFPPDTTDRLALALAKAYNDRHADDPVRQVDLVVLAVQLHPPATESRALPSCELLKHYEISLAPSN
jgi:hypothetical protein